MAVEANGKHVLMRLASGRTIHSHMRMQGAWHVYPTGRTWHRPGFEARLVLEAGERQAVCFNAPVVSLANTPAVDHLGPDLITEPVDFDAIAHRVALQPATLEVGDLLLDQRVAAGIGNIWRCETLFRHGVHPQAPLGSVPSPLDLYRTASKLLRASTWGRRDQPWVSRRTGDPCRRCGTRIASGVVGTHARRAYWCPVCQSLPPPSAGA